MNRILQLIVISLGIHAIQAIQAIQTIQNFHDIVSSSKSVLDSADMIAFLYSNFEDNSKEDYNLEPLFEMFCSENTQNLNRSLNELYDCAGKIDDSTPLCVITPEVVECAKPFATELEKCLPEESKGVIHLILKGIASVIHRFCKLSGDLIIELVNPCIYNDIDKCYNEVNDAVSKYNDQPFTVENVCSVAFTLRGCLHSQIEMSCKNPKARDVALGIYESFIEPCASIHEENKVH